MRNALHRAVLRRLVLRLSVLTAFALALLAMLTPTSWFAGDPALVRLSMSGLAFGLVALPLGMSFAKKPRARATAPRAVVSEA